MKLTITVQKPIIEEVDLPIYFINDTSYYMIYQEKDTIHVIILYEYCDRIDTEFYDLLDFTLDIYIENNNLELSSKDIFINRYTLVTNCLNKIIGIENEN